MEFVVSGAAKIEAKSPLFFNSPSLLEIIFNDAELSFLIGLLVPQKVKDKPPFELMSFALRSVSRSLIIPHPSPKLVASLGSKVYSVSSYFPFIVQFAATQLSSLQS